MNHVSAFIDEIELPGEFGNLVDDIVTEGIKFVGDNFVGDNFLPNNFVGDNFLVDNFEGDNFSAYNCVWVITSCLITILESLVIWLMTL